VTVAAARARRRPRLAVWKLASCDGCQLTLLDCEAELLALAERVEIAHFLEASTAVSAGPYDLSLVEGSITTPRDAERIHQIRRASRTLVAIGACATAGGIQALRNFADLPALERAVYPRPEALETLRRSTAVADHVRVDYELRGCPVDKRQLLALVAACLAGRRPDLPQDPVCAECKLAGAVCVLVAGGVPCLGPVTHAGCGALCPRFGRGCYGCFGPAPAVGASQTAALAETWRQLGAGRAEIARAFRSFNAEAAAFHREADRHD
jgi:coenzyme F420-reducing hydrogenase gamma subunit